jgi:two-component system OmpR family response regulator
MTTKDPAHLLIVDDDVRICRMLERYLAREGFTIDLAGDGTQMWAAFHARRPDLVVLDVMLPGVDGLTLARELRSESPVGIIMLTGKSDSVDTIVGLEIGADDYVTKPFENRELLARIRSVLRRTQSAAPAKGDEADSGQTLCFEGWKLDLEQRELITPDGAPAHLTDHEFRLLALLVNHAGTALSRDQILMKLSRRDWNPEDRSVDVSVAKLRKLIERNPSQPRLIRTVRNVGYEFTARVSRAD